MTHDVSPLQEIERRVQLRAKETSLDMASEGGRDRLRSLIAEEVAAWSDAYKRGLRAFDLAEPEVVAERAYRNIAGYGPLEPLLADDDVWEIMVNAPDQIFIKRHRGTSGYHDEAFNDFSALEGVSQLRYAQEPVSSMGTGPHASRSTWYKPPRAHSEVAAVRTALRTSTFPSRPLRQDLLVPRSRSSLQLNRTLGSDRAVSSAMTAECLYHQSVSGPAIEMATGGSERYWPRIATKR
jgi:hypothetical protein